MLIITNNKQTLSCYIWEQGDKVLDARLGRTLVIDPVFLGPQAPQQEGEVESLLQLWPSEILS